MRFYSASAAKPDVGSKHTHRYAEAGGVTRQGIALVTGDSDAREVGRSLGQHLRALYLLTWALAPLLQS